MSYIFQGLKFNPPSYTQEVNRYDKKGYSKYKEATNPDRPLSKEEFVDDLAATSMARLWDVGKTEPIKVGKASPTEGTMPTSIYLILKYFSMYPNAPGKAFAEGQRDDSCGILFF